MPVGAGYRLCSTSHKKTQTLLPTKSLQTLCLQCVPEGKIPRARSEERKNEFKRSKKHDIAVSYIFDARVYVSLVKKK
jgi:hypothetical protein